MILSRLQRQKSWPSSINQWSEERYVYGFWELVRRGRRKETTHKNHATEGKEKERTEGHQRGHDGKRKGYFFIQHSRCPGMNDGCASYGQLES